VYIKSGVLVKYGTVVSVIDSIRDAGFDRIGLVAEKEKMTGQGAGGSSQ
jgi:biopolymer transport protein ExbD